MARDLRDRVIAITGASSGIGAATAEACARAGMHVALAARRVDRLGEVARRVEAAGRRALVVPCDVDRDADVDALIARTLETFGRLDAAFANAGYGLDAAVMDTADEQMRAIFETNFYGTLRVIRAAVPAMRRLLSGELRPPAGPPPSAHVLICSSAASEVAPPTYGAYAATKAAQDAVACALRAELARERIHVTSVHPIGTDTEFFARARRSGSAPRDPAGGTPVALRQTPGHVAARIVRAMRQDRPAPEVWPHTLSRLGIAAGMVAPRLVAWALRRHYRRLLREG
jgi:NAD(P)-dependent dehydrogenase (short-subunit alcohol dehydrogenase family)